MEQNVTKISQVLPVLKQAPYFTRQNLALALDKEGENLNYWVKKLVSEDLLIPLKQGLYISAYYQDLVRQNPAEYEAYREFLANVLRFPSYVSLEYVLAKGGFLAEEVFGLTSVTIKSSRSYNTKLGSFIYRSVKEDLFCGWKSKSFRGQEIKIAPLSKALFDLLYLKPLPDDWKGYLLTEGRFNWEVLDSSGQSDFAQIVKNSDSKKMARMLKFMQNEQLITKKR